MQPSFASSRSDMDRVGGEKRCKRCVSGLGKKVGNSLGGMKSGAGVQAVDPGSAWSVEVDLAG